MSHNVILYFCIFGPTVESGDDFYVEDSEQCADNCYFNSIVDFKPFHGLNVNFSYYKELL